MQNEEDRNDPAPEFPGVGKITVETFRSGGKGGQNVNKVESGVRLRAPILDPELLLRLRERYPSFVTDDGKFLVEVTEERTQGQNKRIAYERLAERLTGAQESPVERVETKIPRAARRKRLEQKRHTGEKKVLRKPIREW